MRLKVFSVEFAGVVDLTAEQIWPDGDGPNDPTAEDVRKVMEGCGSKLRVLGDWDIDDALEVTVTCDNSQVEVWAPGWRKA